MKKHQHFISNILIITGLTTIVYNGLNFAHGNFRNFSIISGESKIYYFYADNTRILIAVGVALLLCGVFLKNKKDK